MKRMWSIATVLLLIFTLVGCTNQQVNPSTQPSLSQSNFDQAIVENEAQIQVGSGVATTIAMMSLEPSKRAEFGKLAYTVAEAINSASLEQDANLSGVRRIVTAKLNQSNFEQKEVVTYLVSAVSDLIEAKMRDSAFKNADANTRLRAIRTLLRAASKGVMQATETYRPVSVIPSEMRNIAWCNNPAYALQF